MGRLIRARYRTQTTVINLPDQHALSLAGSMGMAVNTFSPMSAGVHDGGASPRGFVGDRGYGVNRFTGDTAPHLAMGAAVQPILTPDQYNLGLGSGVSGQPGLPSTGTTISGPLAWMSAHQLGYGLGG